MDKYLKDEFERNVPESVKQALRLCTETADRQGLQVFLIGGVVRDIIIGKDNLDVDITVQGNGIEFARVLQSGYPDVCKVKEEHDSFKTAKVSVKTDCGQVMLDIASTRKESYPYPASLPVLEETGCELYEDVIRRDFSINSMALSLNESSFCALVDYLGGYDDLKQGIIRVLHPISFIDDPTRIIRALKFSVRFGYKLEDETARLQRELLESGRFDNLAGERIKLELKQAFNTNSAECADRFISDDIYRLVDTGIPRCELGVAVQNAVNEYCKYIVDRENGWLVYLGALLAELSHEKVEQIAQKMYLSGNEEAILLKTIELCENSEALNSAKSRFEVYEFFEKTDIEAIIAFVARNKELEDKVSLYLGELKDVKTIVNGDTLIDMGLQPGPVFSELLRKVLKARINGEITSDKEVGFINNLI
jgi:tRNA nucleotidyltransferase (CCA-adding enzyme)